MQTKTGDGWVDETPKDPDYVHRMASEDDDPALSDLVRTEGYLRHLECSQTTDAELEDPVLKDFTSI